MSTQGLLFGRNFLEQFAGPRLLTDAKTALNELVANAWDAGATEVEITLPISDGDSFIIKDNGSGMTASQFEVRWRTLAYDRLPSQGPTAEFPPGVSPPMRRVFGRNGVGRFAAFCFGDEYTIASSKNGSQTSYRVKRGTEVPLQFIKIAEKESSTPGTVITVSPAKTRLDATTARSELALRFLVDPLFSVMVNGQRVIFHDVPKKNVKREMLEIPSLGSVEITTIDLGSTDKTTQLHGLAFHVSGRLVGDCAWSWLADTSWIDGRTSEAKRFTFIINADVLVGDVLPDWSGFREAPKPQAVLNAVRKFVKAKILEATQEKRDETIAEAKSVSAPLYEKMTPKSKEKWVAFVEEAQTACPSISTSELIALSQVLAKLELADSKYSLLSQLKDLNPDDLDDLNRILSEWTLEAAKVVLDELQKRLLLIQELRLRIESKKTDEVHELQPLFHRGLWIFGPEFETIEFTSNEGMTTVIQKLFSPDGMGSKNRPDFAIVPDGTVGLYDYPSFDGDGGENGVDRLVIVELKKPGVNIGDEQKSQAWKYVRELLALGHINSRTRVTCFVLGSQVSMSDAAKRTELDGRVEIIPMHFETVMARARSRLLKLQDRVANAPFLDKAKLAVFLDPTPAAPSTPTQTTLI